MRRPWLLYLTAFLVVEAMPPHVPPEAKDRQLDLARAAKRFAQLADARREDGVYDAQNKRRGAVAALRRLCSAVAPRK